MQEKQPEVIIHLGLGKVASTYLQYRFFPKLKGLEYIQRTRYAKYPQIIKNSKSNKFFISFECDRQLEAEVDKFARLFPNGKIIILLRRNDSWIASQYRRHVKNGLSLSFNEFVDVENDEGYWKLKYLMFHPMLENIEKVLKRPPLVLFYDDLRKDAYAFFDKIAKYCGAEYKKESINLAKKHKSYNEKQLKVIRSVSKKLFIQKDIKEIKNKVLRKIFQVYPKRLKSYTIMYFALLLPKAWVSKEPLIAPEDLKKVFDFTAEDWAKCEEYANKNNPKDL